ncbi:class I SAM-dependent methyltransferase [bacterium]|nr:class I SAM-dependent methyltransferase [bacterium]
MLWASAHPPLPVFHVKQSTEQVGLARYLTDLRQRLALCVAPDRLGALTSLLSWLAPASHHIGLTKYADPLSLAQNLVAPAIQLLSPSLRPHLSSPALDFGAGCGAVGLSLGCMWPELEVVLADRRQRVVQFLDIAIRRHGLSNCTSLLVDLHRPPEAMQGRFGTVLIRAFGPAEPSLASSADWARPGGTVALWRQPGACPTPDGLNALRTDRTDVPSLVLTLYQRV